MLKTVAHDVPSVTTNGCTWGARSFTRAACSEISEWIAQIGGSSKIACSAKFAHSLRFRSPAGPSCTASMRAVDSEALGSACTDDLKFAAPALILLGMHDAIKATSSSTTIFVRCWGHAMLSVRDLMRSKEVFESLSYATIGWIRGLAESVIFGNTGNARGQNSGGGRKLYYAQYSGGGG